MRCSKAGKLIPKYVDSELEDSLARQLRGHLETCASCAAEEAELRAALGLLAQWCSPEPKLGFEALLSRVEQAGAAAGERTAPLLGVPSWAAAVLAAISIGAGSIIGVTTSSGPPEETPSEQQVASAIGLSAFDDVLGASLTYGVGETDGTENGESL